MISRRTAANACRTFEPQLSSPPVAELDGRCVAGYLGREIRRIATAAVRGGITALLNSPHPRLNYRGGTFAIAWASWHREVIRYPVGARRLALLPMIAGPESLLLGFECPDICYIRYPLPQPSRPAGHARRHARHDPGPGARCHPAGSSSAADHERAGRSRAVRARDRDVPPPPASRSRPDHP
jgi:hypothetical protein